MIGNDNNAGTAYRTRLFTWGVACLAAVGAAGCSDGRPYDIVEVSGTVTYDDGSLIPAESMMLKFSPKAAPIDPKTHPRKGIAQVNVSDGTFAHVTTYKHADGIVAGKHKVTVTAYGKDRESARAVPAEYGDPATTPIEIDAIQAPLEIRVQKPKART
jgi:hypothetical protein